MHVGVEQPLGLANAGVQFRPARVRALDFDAAADDALRQLAGRRFEAHHVGAERRRALGHHCPLGRGFGHEAQLAFRMIARGLKAREHVAQPRFRVLVSGFVFRDRGRCVIAAPGGGALFLLGAALFGEHDVEPPRHARQLIVGSTGLGLISDEGLLEVVMRRDRAGELMLGLGDSQIRAHLMVDEVVHQRANGRELVAQLRRFAAQFKDAARALTGAAFDQPRTVEHFATGRRHRHAHCARHIARDLEAVGDQRIPHHVGDGFGVLTGRAHDRPHRARAGRRGDRRRVHAGAVEHEEAAAAGVLLGEQRQRGVHLGRVVDDDVLEQLAEERIDGALVGAFHFDVIGDRAMLADRVRRLGEQEARGVAERGARGLQVLERLQTGRKRGVPLLLNRQCRHDLDAPLA